jgi:hypothetical protein
MCSGMLLPSAEAAKLTHAPRASRPSTAVTVRRRRGGRASWLREIQLRCDCLAFWPTKA